MKYALMQYDISNLGDTLQTVIARSFLPSVDGVIARETLPEHSGFSELHKCIWNGYFDDDNAFCVPGNVLPLFIAWHASAKTKRFLESLKQPATIAALKQFAPIGCRDTFTVSVMQKLGVEAYFSGCLTSLVEPQGLEKEDYILCVDVPEEIVEIIRSRTKRPIILTTKTNPGGNQEVKLRALLSKIEKAHCVVTSNLHTAIPATAMGVEVRCLLPQDKNAVRFMGWETYFPIVRLSDFKHNYNMLDIEKNINKSSLEPMKSGIKTSIENFLHKV